MVKKIEEDLQPTSFEDELVGLKIWASPEQTNFIDAIVKYRSFNKAAKALNVCRNRMADSIKSLKELAATKGYSPSHNMTQVIPDPFYAKRISSFYRKGELKNQWVIQEQDLQLRKAVVEAYLNVKLNEIKPIEPLDYTEPNPEDFMVVIPIGDPHAGLYTWEKESGEKYDLHEFKKVNKVATDLLFAKCPRAKLVILLDLGDTTHADDSSNRTKKSGNNLSVHGRHSEIIDAVVEVKIYQILRALEHFENVMVRVNRGNHDFETAYMISKILEAHFRNEPRVNIQISPAHYWYYKFGSVMVGSSHGDGAKGADMGAIMATDEPEMWGSTDCRVVFLGHIHHRNIVDYSGVTVEYARTLAAPSAWEKFAGYRSKRSIDAVVFDKEGEYCRYTVTFKKISKYTG